MLKQCSSGKSSFKRIRTDNHDSFSDPETPVQPRKRVRQISSDSGEDLDSQTTVSYGLESQRSDATEVYDLTKDGDEEEPLSEDKEKKVQFLKDCFKEKSRAVSHVYLTLGCLMIFATLFKVIPHSSCTYSCFPGICSTRTNTVFLPCDLLHTCVSCLSHTSTNSSFLPKPLTTFLLCFSGGERQK